MARTKHMAELTFKVGADVAKLQQGLKRAKKNVNSFSNTAKKMGGTLVAAFAGMALLQGIKSAILGIAALDKALKRVALTAKGDQKEFEKLAKQLGGSTSFTALEAADAMQFLAQAGFSANAILKATPGILELAAAASMDLAIAADIASNILSGFGLSADEVNRVNDILVTTTDNANTNVEQMGEAFKMVAPIAKSAGMSINEAAGFIGVLGDAGIQGTMAGTQLKGAIAALINPTAKGAAVLKRLGVEVSMTEDGSLNLTKTLEDLSFAGLTTKDAFQLFNKISATGALVMANATEKASELALATEEVGVAATKSSELMNTLSGDLDKLSSSWDANVKEGSRLNDEFRFLTQAITAYSDALRGEGIFFKKKIDTTKEYLAWQQELADSIFRQKNIEAELLSAQKLTNDELQTRIDKFKKNGTVIEVVSALEEELTKRKQEESDINAELVKDLGEEEEARLKVAKSLEKQANATAKAHQAELSRQASKSPGSKGVLDGSGGLLAFAPLLDSTRIKLKETTDSFLDFQEKGQLVSGFVGNAFSGMSNVISDSLNSTENVFQAFGKFFGDFIKGLVFKLIAATLAALALTVVLSALGIAGGAGVLSKLGEVSTFGSAFKANLGGLGGFANGGLTDGGLAMVGERGRELVNLPSGSRVHSAKDTKQMLSGASNGVMIADVRLRGEDIWLSFTEAERKRGNTRG